MMKAKYLFIGLALACVLGACSRDEESLFDKNASERAQEAMDNANEVLVLPEFGWEMIYFANPDSKGYNMIVKFEENGRVIATAKNKETTNDKILTDSTSTWQVKLDYGPIITFDTYNNVLHAWADSQSDGDGLLGDYEFLILSATADRVVLKGKKHSAYCILRPMPNMTAEDYFAGCASTLNKYFGNNNILTLNQGGKLYYLHNGSTGLFTISGYGLKVPEEDVQEYPLCATLDGIMMCYGFNGVKNERLFVYEGDKFVGEEGSIISAGDLNQLFVSYIDVDKGWITNLSQTTGVVKDAIAAFETQLKAATKDNKAKVNSIAYTYSDTVYRYQGSYILRLKFEYKSGSKKTTITCDFAVDMMNNEGSVTVTYKQPANPSATTWYNQDKVSEIKSLIDAALGTFTLAAEDPINPAKSLRMTNDGSTLVVSGSGNVK